MTKNDEMNKIEHVPIHMISFKNSDGQNNGAQVGLVLLKANILKK